MQYVQTPFALEGTSRPSCISPKLPLWIFFSVCRIVHSHSAVLGRAASKKILETSASTRHRHFRRKQCSLPPTPTPCWTEPCSDVWESTPLEAYCCVSIGCKIYLDLDRQWYPFLASRLNSARDGKDQTALHTAIDSMIC